ncbi:MAG TPA: hypothetical protein VGX49_17425 [Jatrophihabitans sp.]|jgi:hypothetical protein|nr:hypothetical protein [Jatrophihabitans sp.]
MTDLDTTIKDLINSAVDRELADHRAAPPFDRSAVADRPGPASAVRLWSVPLLAASIAVLLAVGAMLAITLNRDQSSNHVSDPAGPTPSLSLSRSINPDLEAAARAYAEAVAGAAPDPSKLAGVSVSPISAADAVRYKNGSVLRAEGPEIANPRPGKTYSFTMSYLAGPGEPTAVVSIELRDVASGSCPQPFLARPAYTYRIRCQVTFLASAAGEATLSIRSLAGVSSATANLVDPAKYPSPTSTSSAAQEYSEALAGAPEASTVAGVSERPATADEVREGEGIGTLESPVVQPERGRSYPMTFSYVPRSDGPAVSVLTFKFEDVTAGRCPRAFRIRPGHAYRISCQVTFRPGAVGKGYYLVRGPQGVETMGITLSLP